MIVMKFGGTSVADAKAIARVIHLIKTRRDKKTIVVVSAISEATNILTKVATLAAQNKVEKCNKILAKFKNRHLKIAKNLLHNKKLLKQTQERINIYLAELSIVIKKTSLLSKCSDRNFAKIVAYGELLSSIILHTAMLEHDLKNTLIDARTIIITNNNYQKGTPNLEKMTRIMPPLLNKCLNKGDIVLTQGFIAGNINGVTAILGREGSDYSASLIGMIMNTNEIQIWTDVDGIMTSDPKKIANTKFIPHLSFNEAANLSYFGAKVIHPLTIQPAAKKNIPVRILNSMNLDPKQKGTLITHETKTKKIKISSITYKENIKIINISSKQTSSQNNFLQKIFSLFAKNQVIIDAAIISETNVSVALNQSEKFVDIVNELATFAKISYEKDRSLVAIIGKNFSNIEKIAKNVFKILNGFNIRMMVHGSSDNNLILIVPKNDLITIIQKLHDAFFGYRPQ